MMTRSAARYAVNVAAYCSGALVIVSGLTAHFALGIAGLLLMLACGALAMQCVSGDETRPA